MKKFQKWDKNIGTLISDLNFLVESEYEHAWDTLKKDASLLKIENNLTKYVAQATEPNIALVGLQNDLTKFFSRILPDQTISLSDMLGLLGFYTQFGTTNMHNCSSYRSSDAIVCRKMNQLKVAKGLHPLHGFDFISHTDTECDLGMYLDRWLGYLRNSPTTTNGGKGAPKNGM